MKYFETWVRSELFGFFKCQSVTDRGVDSEPPVDLRFGRFRAGGSVDAGPWTPLPVIQKHKINKTYKKKKKSSNSVKLREEGRERGNWVRSRGEIARRRQRQDRAALESIFA